MGWTTMHATHYKNGTVDRKAEIDAIWNDDVSHKFQVLKSAIKGTTYYGAIKQTETNEVFAVIFLTSIDMSEYFNFSYKDMDETYGPYHCDCPKGILDLLTPTDNEYALKWRENCYQNLKIAYKRGMLSKLPIGTVIRFTDRNGTAHEYVKHPPAYQFKCSFWKRYNGNTYIKKRNIPNDYEVIK